MNRTLISVLTATLVLLLGLSAPVYAVTPAGVLPLQVEVRFKNGHIEVNTAAVTVELVPAAPILSEPPNQKQKVSEGLGSGPITYNFTVTSSANGPALYKIVYPNENFTGDSVILLGAVQGEGQSGAWASGDTVLLGATAAIGESETLDDGAIRIPVPSDGVVDPAGRKVVNGIEAGDVVVIKEIAFDVSKVEEWATGGRIFLHPSPEAGEDFSVSVGDLIAEQHPFTLTITNLGLDDKINAKQGTLQIQVAASAVSDETLIDSHEIVTGLWEVSTTKLTYYVRNETPGSEGDAEVAYPSPPSDDDTKNFYNMGDVTVSAGDILTFALVQTGGSQEGSTGLLEGISGVVFTPTIPAFTSYVDGSTFWNGVEAVVCADGAELPEETSGQTGQITIRPTGCGCEVLSTDSIGSDVLEDCDGDDIAAFSAVEVTFSVKIDESTTE